MVRTARKRTKKKNEKIGNIQSKGMSEVETRRQRHGGKGYGKVWRAETRRRAAKAGSEITRETRGAGDCQQRRSGARNSKSGERNAHSSSARRIHTSTNSREGLAIVIEARHTEHKYWLFDS